MATAASEETSGPPAVIRRSDPPAADPAAAGIIVIATPTPAAPTSRTVLASWYGPGFYGNRTACGQTYTREIAGVAHRTLPCGSIVTLGYRGRSVRLEVIDRGPAPRDREFDLSNAARAFLECPDLCRVEWLDTDDRHR